jgi:hypothetical protein
LSLIGTLAREYGWPPETIRRLPLAEVLCYHAEILQFHEIDTHAPSFTERDLIAAVF